MDLVIRGYPSRIRYPDWRKANSLPPEELPTLSQRQKDRARILRISDRAYAIGLKAAELARERLTGELEHVASVVQAVAKKRDAEVTALIWNFYEHHFQIVTRWDGKESSFDVPGELVNAILLGKHGAEQKLGQEVDFWLGGWAE
jgi:hypothetical protein